MPLILHSMNPAVIEAGLAHCADKRPLIYAATNENADAMAKLAKDKKYPLAIKADGLDALTALSEKIKGLGVEDIVLDSGARRQRTCLSILR